MCCIWFSTRKNLAAWVAPIDSFILSKYVFLSIAAALPNQRLWSSSNRPVHLSSFRSSSHSPRSVERARRRSWSVRRRIDRKPARTCRRRCRLSSSDARRTSGITRRAAHNARSESAARTVKNDRALPGNFEVGVCGELLAFGVLRRTVTLFLGTVQRSWAFLWVP